MTVHLETVLTNLLKDIEKMNLLYLTVQFNTYFQKVDYEIHSFVDSFGPADEGLILLAKSAIPSWESDITEWFESSPIALIGVSDLKIN